MTPDTSIKTSAALTEASPSVQIHLGIIQNVIARMAGNSSACKTWCITVVSAVLVLVADKSQPDFAYIALIPTLLFCVLDTYYLALEKGFRASYCDFVNKLHNGKLLASDLYSVEPAGEQVKHQWTAFKSLSVWLFYVSLGLLIWISKIVIFA